MGENPLKIIPEQINTALTTLASQTALKIGSDYESTVMQKTLLLKKTKAHITWTGATAGEGPVIVGMARGEATITHIKDALEQPFKPEDGGDRYDNSQEMKRCIVWQSLRTFYGTSGGAAHINYEFQHGGKNGIPYDENVGWQWFAYNLSSGSLTTGSSIIGQLHHYGVVLRG